MLLFLAILASEIGAMFVETGSHVTESFFLCTELNLL